MLRKNFIVLALSPTIIKFVISEVELQNLLSHYVKMKMTRNVCIFFESQVECEESGGKLCEGEMEKRHMKFFFLVYSTNFLMIYDRQYFLCEFSSHRNIVCVSREALRLLGRNQCDMKNYIPCRPMQGIRFKLAVQQKKYFVNVLSCFHPRAAM